jgi:small subunit ribosomal protein S9
MPNKSKNIAKEDQLATELPPVQKVRKGFISGTGRRKTAVARVFLYESKGDITVNGMDIDDYFKSKKDKLAWKKPFHLVGVSHPTSRFSASVKVHGSGKPSQLDAVIHGISRALAKLSEENRKVLRREGLLTRDSRVVERKKYWLRKARKAPQYSKR